MTGCLRRRIDQDAAWFSILRELCDEVELSLHVLRDCPLAMPVWVILVGEKFRSDFFRRT